MVLQALILRFRSLSVLRRNQQIPHFPADALKRVVNGLRRLAELRRDLPVIEPLHVLAEHLRLGLAEGIENPLSERAGILS